MSNYFRKAVSTVLLFCVIMCVLSVASIAAGQPREGSTVRPGSAGDINNDGEINAKDAVLLAQYLASWDVTVNENAADTNGDFAINAKDAVLLAQYLASWDVELVNRPYDDVDYGDNEFDPGNVLN